MIKHTPASPLPFSEFRDEDSHDLIAADGTHIARFEPRCSQSPQQDQDRDANYLVHTARAYPKLVAELKELLARNIWRGYAEDKTRAATLLRELGEI